MTLDIIASCNMRFTLADGPAEAGLRKVLDESPHIVALQEWGPDRTRILQRIAKDGTYDWARPGGDGGPILWDNDRYVRKSGRGVRLAGTELVGHLIGRKTKLPASIATEIVLDDLEPHGQTVAVINYHLTAEVQMGADYRKDLAHRLRVRRHKRERRRLARRARYHLKRGRRTYLCGDGNFDSMQLKGLTNCWDRRPGGTLGHRAVDIVFADIKPRNVRAIETPSDHKAIVVTYERKP